MKIGSRYKETLEAVLNEENDVSLVENSSMNLSCYICVNRIYDTAVKVKNFEKIGRCEIETTYFFHENCYINAAIFYYL